MPMYNFDPAEEQDDLEQELLDHGRDGSPAGPNSKVSTTAASPNLTRARFGSRANTEGGGLWVVSTGG